MDHGAVNVIYLDRRAVNEHVRRTTLSQSWAMKSANPASESDTPGYFNVGKPPHSDEILANVESILSVFNDVHVCSSGSSCLAKLSELKTDLAETVPTILLIDIPYAEEQRLKRLSREPRTPSPNSLRKPGHDQGEPEDLYGFYLLQHLSSEIQQKVLSKFVIPIAVLSGLDKELGHLGNPIRSPPGSQVPGDGVRIWRYIDAGAVDVYTSPLSKSQVHGLAVHAYRTRREVSKEDSSFFLAKRNRKVSWVGVDETKPYSYLREAMVSGLMNGICNPETIGDTLDPNDFDVSDARRAAVAQAIGTWAFSAHDFTDDELLLGALMMLQHALSMPELEQWKMDTDELTIMLLASRAAYNQFVLYHNFRHVVDVLQALFFFLVQIGTLPDYPTSSKPRRRSSQPAIAALLKPFDALTLLVSAIGHDVGHPGVNNAFLVALNSPLAQLYNDRSVLESFHCAAYSQILRRYWPEAFADVSMRKLMINSILATDMGLHFKYMSDLGNLQQKLAHNHNTLDGVNPKTCEEYKELICGLLIKCADISNVARKFDTAAQWARIITDEFSNQGVMEEELQMPTCLFGGPPVQDSIIKMSESQIGFMNIFARPLFEAVSDVLPAMRFGLEEMLANKKVWEHKIEKERDAQNKMATGLLNPVHAHEAVPSPFSEVPASVDAKQPHRASQNVGPASRPVSGSIPFQFSLNAAATSSRRSSVGYVTPTEKDSRRSSRQLQSSENVSTSRRGSADASLTAILVTHKQQSSPSASPGVKKASSNFSGRATRVSHDREPLRNPWESKGRSSAAPQDSPGVPVSPAATHGNISSHRHTQSESESDLSQDVNGIMCGKAPRNWDTSPRPTIGSGEWNVGQANETPNHYKSRPHTGSTKWTSGSWRRDRSKVSDANTQKEATSYLATVNSSQTSGSSYGRRKEKFGLGKFWRKITNGDREDGDLVSPKSKESQATSRDDA